MTKAKESVERKLEINESSSHGITDSIKKDFKKKVKTREGAALSGLGGKEQ